MNLDGIEGCKSTLDSSCATRTGDNKQVSIATLQLHRHAGALCDGRILRDVLGFTMHRYRNRGFHPSIQTCQLILAGMTRCMHG